MRAWPAALLLACAAAQAGAQADEAAPAPLTGQPGDAARGRAIVADRRVGLCLLCHRAPIAEERFQGDLAPDLAGAGSRYDAAQLRLRLVAPQALNAETVMPAYYRRDGLREVAPQFAGKTILSAQQIEDVVAYLATLK